MTLFFLFKLNMKKMFSTKPCHFIWKSQFSNMSIYFCNLHLHFLLWSPTYEKRPATPHRSAQNWDAVLLLCRCPMLSSPLETWPKQRKILKLPAFSARAGLAQRLEGPAAWFGSPWASLNSNAASGLKVLYLSPAALPPPSSLPFPSLTKQKALQSMEIQNCSSAISLMAVMKRPPLSHVSSFM